MLFGKFVSIPFDATRKMHLSGKENNFWESELVRAGLLKWTGQKYLFPAARLSTHLISTFCNIHDDFSRGLSS